MGVAEECKSPRLQIQWIMELVSTVPEDWVPAKEHLSAYREDVIDELSAGIRSKNRDIASAAIGAVYWCGKFAGCELVEPLMEVMTDPTKLAKDIRCEAIASLFFCGEDAAGQGNSHPTQLLKSAKQVPLCKDAAKQVPLCKHAGKQVRLCICNFWNSLGPKQKTQHRH